MAVGWTVLSVWMGLVHSGRLMDKHALFVHYWLNPIPKKEPEPVVVSDATTLVIPYHKWIKNKCKCCGRGGASALCECEFSTYTTLHLLCAACMFRGAFAKWSGFFGPKLIRVDLKYTLTYPNRHEPPNPRASEEISNSPD